MKDYGLDAKDILVIDDLNTGYEMAKSAGTKFAYPMWAETKADETLSFMSEKADYMFSDIEEFKNAIL